ncbi:thiopeptide-type bacteriocin biosynthesis protein [Saccharothrix obliqua]|uniref:thiopeptide-type bacteriocin biosynthesis protein n=1 Tax=Saccharothrix obliqua TaxID=2861747 RepID=UPI001C5E433E|nr:thiopeptide-type bacteriocin biosynthesis protein [Saccharothrix obliqua]MBW4722280.1 thiopeptide-type bacteriocin biosynthesis protein [Saccharothrix obliqua]
MPAHRLTWTPSPVEAAIWRVLAGDDLDTTAEMSGLDPEELTAATTIYRQAGHDTLSAHRADSWHQVYIRFHDWTRAEHTAASHLLPALTRAEHSGAITQWWFMRKHPCWRLRILPAHGHDTLSELATTLDDLTAAGHIDTWWPGLYEAETAAFGGQNAIDAGHHLFTADSRGVLELAAAGGTGLGRRELSILLCGTLMRDGAALEWYERGDVWDRVSAERPLPADIDSDRIAAMARTLRTLALADTTPDGPLFAAGGPLAPQSGWAAAFRDTGHDLADANRAGRLTRGLRDVLSYHVIFHWNRLGLTARTQAILAHSARHAILGPTTPSSSTPHPASATPVPTPSLDQAIIRFPLIHQGRQFCGDLPARVGLVEEHATNSARYDDVDKRINAAAAAWNLAALIAADCDIPSLAEELCVTQFEIFHQSWPLSGRPAIAGLQPLVNLARLAQRTGEPQHAYDALVRIEHAVDSGAAVGIAGREIPFTDFIAPGGDHGTVKAWLRRTLREDGTRALIAAGDWKKAADHASHYDDTPELLHEARQTRVIALARAGHRDDALRLIDSATTTHPWHRAIASCLRAYTNLTAGYHDPTTTNTLITNVQTARTAAADPVMTMFRVRISLAAAHLAAATHRPEADLLRAEAAQDAHRSGNAYAAREVLEDDACRQSPPSRDVTTLKNLVASAGLRQGTIPEDLRRRLHAATHQAADVLEHALT